MHVAPVTLDRPYQTEGANFLANRDRALLAFDTRLGKTRTALRAAQLVQARRVLVIAPAIGRLSWAAEAPRVDRLPLFVVRPGEPPGLFVHMDHVRLVLSYDALSHDHHGWADALAKGPRWDVLILDECQYLKSVGSKRTRAVYGRVKRNARRVWLLSATPTPNNAGEFFPHLKALWPELLPGQGSRHEFEDRYCVVLHTPWGRRIRGSRNQAELRAKIAPFVLRRRKQDVFADLPRMAHNMVPLDLGPPGKLSAQEQAQAGSELDRLLAAPLSAESQSVQRVLGEEKALPASAWLREQLENDTIGKVLVFAWHRSVLQLVYEQLVDFMPLIITGETNDRHRTERVAAFQRDPERRVLLGQIKACGTAICLSAADDVVLLEPSWVPGDNYQAASRAEDPAARNPVTVSWLYAPGTLDERIMAILRAKTKQISEIWD